MKNINKKSIAKVALTAAMAGSVLMQSVPAAAHGWVINDRAHLSSANGGRRNTNMGTVAFNPQSAGEFGLNGQYPVEMGRASLNDAVSANSGNLSQRFIRMSDYGHNRFYRNRMAGGRTGMRWNFTALHRTRTIRYYVNNSGFSANEPLDYADFDEVARFHYNGNNPSSLNVHNVDFPTNLRGPGAILITWHVSSPRVSWYRIKDVYWTGDGTAIPVPPAPVEPEVPAPPVTPPAPVEPEVPAPPVTPPAPVQPETPAPPVTPPAPVQPETPAPPVTPPAPVQPETPAPPVAPSAPSVFPIIWNGVTNFPANQRVIRNGLQWHARVANQGVTPGTNANVWQMMGSAPAGPTQWDINSSYTANQRVVHNNFQWHARVNSQGVRPGTNSAVWQMMGAAPR